MRGVDLEVYAGELTLLVGPSGCGKTTLLSVMVGILNPTEGEVHVLGTDLETLSDGKKAVFRSRHIGFVFQQFNLLPALDATENVAVPLAIAGWKKRPAMGEASAQLEKVGLGHRLTAVPGRLSGGEQQRVAIARALVSDPRLIVCDEPTSSLDGETGHRVMELLKNVAVESSRSVVVVTHDPRVLEFGDRIAHMADGKVTRVETEVSAQQELT